VDTLSSDVLGVIQYYGEKSAIIVGHDWGGVVAWHFAYRYPEYTKALIIMNAPHPVRFEEVLRGSRAQRIKSLYILAFQIPRLPEWYLGRKGAKMHLQKRISRNIPAIWQNPGR
jgi:pimeloyl-ACP methyl ester carboxylesterase